MPTHMKVFKEDTEAVPSVYMDKTAIGFITDILYIKGVICFEEFDDIMEAKYPTDLQDIIEKMLRGEYNAYKRGEGYISNDGE